MNQTVEKHYLARCLPRTLGPFNVFILLNGWICLHGALDYSRLLVGFRTHFKSLHFHFISFHFS